MFEPVSVMTVDSPEQMKAFTDPLRIRVLIFLIGQEATNQQVADALNEPHAKVLYHVRFLLKNGLITLVDTRIKGGNVEKYYRATARTFDFRPAPEFAPELAIAEIDAVRQDAAVSAVRFPEYPPQATIRGWHATPERAQETFDEISRFIETQGRTLEHDFPLSETLEPDATEAPAYHFALVMYRNPHDPSRKTGD